MANELTISVGATENASTTIAGVGAAAVRTERVIVQSMGSTEEAFDTAARSSGKFGAAMDRTAGAVGTASDGLQGVADVAGGISEIMSRGARKAEELAQAHQDVAQAAFDAEQALQDLDQANRDLAQSEIDTVQAGVDLEQALLDQTTATTDYNKAVKEFGAGSAEAKQALIDMKQAQVDATQAQEDAKQAAEDYEQAQLDAGQATLDVSQAQNDLATSQRAVTESGSQLKQVAEWGGLLSGVLGGLVGIIGVITAVQWAWNAAMTANPIGIVIALIVVVVGVIVYLAVKTTFFKDLWNGIWSAIGEPVKAAGDFIVGVWDFLVAMFMTNINLIRAIIVGGFKFAVDFVVGYFRFLMAIPGHIGNAFASVGQAIFAPFKWAFNNISSAWNKTVGKLNISIPSWVPGIGGNSFAFPKLPMLQHGGQIMRTGAVLAHAGERILPASTRGLFNDVNGGGVLRIIVQFVGGHDAFHQFMKENVKIFGAGSVVVAYDQ